MFTTNDRVKVRKQGKTYTATVTKGPFKVPGEKLEHYHAKWDDKEYEITNESRIRRDLRSKTTSNFRRY